MNYSLLSKTKEKFIKNEYDWIIQTLIKYETLGGSNDHVYRLYLIEEDNFEFLWENRFSKPSSIGICIYECELLPFQDKTKEGKLKLYNLIKEKILSNIDKEMFNKLFETTL